MLGEKDHMHSLGCGSLKDVSLFKFYTKPFWEASWQSLCQAVVEYKVPYALHNTQFLQSFLMIMDSRVHDYLDDKLQSSADLEGLNSLLETLKSQQGLLKRQVCSTTTN